MHTKEVRSAARAALKGVCRVCPVCDGNACAGEMPGMGGCGSGASFKANVAAIARRTLNMRVLHGVENCNTGVSFWGAAVSMPIMVAPMAGASVNLGGAISEEAMVRALNEGAKAAGATIWGGDGIGWSFFDLSLAAMSAVGNAGIPTIKPKTLDEIRSAMQKAEAVGSLAVAIDFDAMAFYAARTTGKRVGPRSFEDLCNVVKSTKLPCVFKGIMTVDEALLAAKAGAAGIVVSNHGGRALDCVPGTADVLAPIAKAVRDKMIVFVDGGVRSGTDTLKMLALGAHAVLVGRPLLVAAVGGGSEAVAAYLNHMRTELAQAMMLTGLADLRNVPESILFAG